MMLYPLNDGIGSVELLMVAGTDQDIVDAARVSFDKVGNTDPEANAKLIRYLLKHKHLSPFEHNMIKFRIKCPIFVDRQIVRHRIGISKNEISARYVEVKDEFYVPASLRKQSKSNRQASVDGGGDLDDYIGTYRLTCASAVRSYHILLDEGVCREQARGVLPQAMYTTSIYTFNLRSLLHFVDLRTHAGAQWEIQQYASAMRQLVEPSFPLTFGASHD